jgi:hypothetical protein
MWKSGGFKSVNCGCGILPKAGGYCRDCGWMKSRVADGKMRGGGEVLL